MTHGRKGLGTRSTYAYIRISLDNENPGNQEIAILEWAREHVFRVEEWFRGSRRERRGFPER